MSTAVGQEVACTPVTQRARVRFPVGTSFLGEVFSGFSSSTSFRPLRFPKIIWPSSSIIIRYGRQWHEMLTRPKTSNIHTYIHTYMHAYIHTCIHAYVHASMHARTHARTHAHTHAHTHIHTYIHTYTLNFKGGSIKKSWRYLQEDPTYRILTRMVSWFRQGRLAHKGQMCQAHPKNFL